MTLQSILEIADAHYPDGMILAHWDTLKGKPRTRSAGDTLALFVVNEIYETYDPRATDARQLHEAARVIQRAIDELVAVQGALSSASVDRSLADWCARQEEQP